jgi:hypothetical protein
MQSLIDSSPCNSLEGSPQHPDPPHSAHSTPPHYPGDAQLQQQAAMFNLNLSQLNQLAQSQPSLLHYEQQKLQQLAVHASMGNMQPGRGLPSYEEAVKTQSGHGMGHMGMDPNGYLVQQQQQQQRQQQMYHGRCVYNHYLF